MGRRSKGSHWKSKEEGGGRLIGECSPCGRDVLRKGEWAVSYTVKLHKGSDGMSEAFSLIIPLVFVEFLASC